MKIDITMRFQTSNPAEDDQNGFLKEMSDLPELASKMHIRWLTVAYNLCFRSDVFIWPLWEATCVWYLHSLSGIYLFISLFIHIHVHIKEGTEQER